MCVCVVVVVRVLRKSTNNLFIRLFSLRIFVSVCECGISVCVRGNGRGQGLDILTVVLKEKKKAHFWLGRGFCNYVRARRGSEWVNEERTGAWWSPRVIWIQSVSILF